MMRLVCVGLFTQSAPVWLTSGADKPLNAEGNASHARKAVQAGPAERSTAKNNSKLSSFLDPPAKSSEIKLERKKNERLDFSIGLCLYSPRNMHTRRVKSTRTEFADRLFK